MKARGIFSWFIIVLIMCQYVIADVEVSYQEVIDTCIFAWNMGEELVENRTVMSDQQVHGKLDAVLARLLYACLCAHHMARDSKNKVQQVVDSDYLDRMFTVLEYTYDSFFTWYGEYERMLCIKYLFAKLRKKINYLVSDSVTNPMQYPVQ